ncbi:MAG: hypothetical protein AB7P03_00475 [Kofleriaceae bacterium]
MSRLVSLAALLAGCATTAQSARVLEVGKTQFTAGLARTSISDDGSDESLPVWSGDVMVRHGVAPRVDVGARLTRVPGFNTVSAFTADPKVELTAPGSPTAVSLSLPLGAGWSDADDDGTLFIAVPTLLIGHQISPTVELVLAPRLFVFHASEGSEEDTELDFGGSIGARFHDAARTWAIQPELAIVRFGDDDIEDAATTTAITFGLAVSAGN